MRMLIVDDDEFGRNMMQKLMDDIAECAVAKSGSGAITAFKKAREKWIPFDIMTLDINMPDMSGKEVLELVRDYEKAKKIPKEEQIKILMATASADKETIIDCIKAGCNDYVTKPFQRDMLVKKFKKLGYNIAEAMRARKAQKDAQILNSTQAKASKTVKEIISNIMENANNCKIEVPAFSKAVYEIQGLLNRPNTDIDQLARVIETDFAVVEKLISVSNSPLYRGTDQTGNIQKAISRIGVSETKDIVTAIANKSIYKTGDVHLDKLFEWLWSHSLACAYAARLLATAANLPDVETYFLMGLVHDIGKPLLLKMITEQIDCIRGFNLDEVIDEIQEVHTAFGAIILRRLGFSDNFVNVARRHEVMESSFPAGNEILIIHLANIMCRITGHSLFKQDVDLSLLESARQLSLGKESLEEIVKKVTGLMYVSAASF